MTGRTARAFVLLLSTLSVPVGFAVAADEPAAVVLAADDGQRWYRGNTHAHTLWSDGDAPPETVVDWYRERGYHFLCLSDHNILADGSEAQYHPVAADGHLTPARVRALRKAYGKDWVVEREINDRPYMRLKTLPELKARFERPGGFALIPAEELTAWIPTVHVNAVNVDTTIIPTNEMSVERALTAMLDAIDARAEATGRPMLGHINHPNFSDGIKVEALIAIRGERFFEVYNGHNLVRNEGSTRRGMPSTERMWDIVLSMRLREGNVGVPLWGLATDDAHQYYEEGASLANAGRGWIVVLAPELSADAIVRAIRAGRFYASTGVTLDAIRHDGAELRVAMKREADVTYTVEFIGTPKDFDPSSTPIVDDKGEPLRRASRRYSEAIGTVLYETSDNPAVYRFTGNELYVRARIVSSRPQANPLHDGDRETAWTQPVVVP